ncbi:hypothetical protein FGO68_gene3384 [Halteria grandinella]|uniref:Uncharacterized protein n=1 Tax=Halteria grandinella TaxID=5974 RepID=A0A8J8NYB2_HALGN|nr:hypothetical protein FGO68_gene3384 [Halteria grandinella]
MNSPSKRHQFSLQLERITPHSQSAHLKLWPDTNYPAPMMPSSTLPMKMLDLSNISQNNENDELVNIQCGSTQLALLQGNGMLHLYDLQRLEKIPTPLSQDIIVKQVALGLEHALLFGTFASDVCVMAWGRNDRGQLGLGFADTCRIEEPTELPFFTKSSLKGVASLQCGEHHSGLLDDCGQLFLWGCNREGQLGFGQMLEEKVKGQRVQEAQPFATWPQQIRNVPECMLVSQFSLGANQTLLLTQVGSLYQTSSHLSPKNTTFSLLTLPDPSPISKIGSKGSLSSALFDSKDLYVFTLPPSGLKLWSKITSVEDFQLSQSQLIVKIHTPTEGEALMQLKIASDNKLEPFLENSRDLKMVACGPNYVVGLIKPEVQKKKAQKAGSRTVREQPRQEIPQFQHTPVAQPRRNQSLHQKSLSQASIPSKSIKELQKQEKSASRSRSRENSYIQQQNSDILHVKSHSPPHQHISEKPTLQKQAQFDQDSVKTTSEHKALLKDALLKEIAHRKLLEKQLQILQEDFETFKRDLQPVNQQENSLVVEYEKLYNACLEECEKAQQYYSLYQSEEQRVIEVTEENRLLKERNLELEKENESLKDNFEGLKQESSQLQSKYEELRQEREEETKSVMRTVIDQQRTIEMLRGEIQTLQESIKTLQSVHKIQEIQKPTKITPSVIPEIVKKPIIRKLSPRPAQRSTENLTTLDSHRSNVSEVKQLPTIKKFQPALLNKSKSRERLKTQITLPAWNDDTKPLSNNSVSGKSKSPERQQRGQTSTKKLFQRVKSAQFSQTVRGKPVFAKEIISEETQVIVNIPSYPEQNTTERTQTNIKNAEHAILPSMFTDQVLATPLKESLHIKPQLGSPLQQNTSPDAKQPITRQSPIQIVSQMPRQQSSQKSPQMAYEITNTLQLADPFTEQENSNKKLNQCLLSPEETQNQYPAMKPISILQPALNANMLIKPTEMISSPIKSPQKTSQIDSLQQRLEHIRKSKAMLEAKMRDFELKKRL